MDYLDNPERRRATQPSDQASAENCGFQPAFTRKALADAQIGEDAREQIPHRNAAAMLARVARTAQPESAAA